MFLLSEHLHQISFQKTFYPTTDLFSFWTSNVGFASDFVDSFTNRVIEDEIVPDLLIEVLANSRPSQKEFRSAEAVKVYQDLLRVVIYNEAQKVSSEILHDQRAR